MDSLVGTKLSIFHRTFCVDELLHCYKFLFIHLIIGACSGVVADLAPLKPSIKKEYQSQRFAGNIRWYLHCRMSVACRPFAPAWDRRWVSVALVSAPVQQNPPPLDGPRSTDERPLSLEASKTKSRGTSPRRFHQLLLRKRKPQPVIAIHQPAAFYCEAAISQIEESLH